MLISTKIYLELQDSSALNSRHGMNPAAFRHQNFKFIVLLISRPQIVCNLRLSDKLRSRTAT
jgi:hypothetical protein